MEAFERTADDGRRVVRAVADPATTRRTLPNRVAYALVASVIGLGLFASLTPSPLYRTYSVLWHFSPLTLTLIYATYAFGVLATLLLAGSVSDQVGRRPVLLVSLGGLMASTRPVPARRLGRLALRRPRPPGPRDRRGDRARRARRSSISTRAATPPASVSPTPPQRRAASGSACSSRRRSSRSDGSRGSCPTSSCSSCSRSRSRAPTGCRSRCSKRSRFRLTVARPSVPAVVRRPFVLAALAVLSSWSIGGLFFSLGPQLAAHLLRHDQRARVGGRHRRARRSGHGRPAR